MFVPEGFSEGQAGIVIRTSVSSCDDLPFVGRKHPFGHPRVAAVDVVTAGGGAVGLGPMP
jgi:hypothetical protein